MIEGPIGGVIGTAGHVDHGKSTLVRAITSIDPDRLAEEKARSMTIDLGFAWKIRPDGSRLSFVDVPGHERFIKNMLAGVGAIDVVLLVIAADEGPMPQTREHLAIIDLLGISNGVVALTKSDLVDDEWLAYIAEEIHELIRGTSITNAPIVPVSAETGTNLELLEATLIEQLRSATGRLDLGRPRLSIDRAFTMGGFGTVVTGTLVDGSMHVGDEVAILPGNQRSRIRGLQVHSTGVERAEPGNRVAINLTGIAVDDIERGQVVCLPASLDPAERIDARISLLPSAPKPIEQDDHFDFFHGASEHRVWLTLLDRERISPGETGWVQLRFRDPVVVARGDRFILRQPSPSLTAGGGVVVDATPPRHRRFQPDVIAALEARERGDPITLIAQLTARRIVSRQEIDRIVPNAGEEIDQAIEELEARGQLASLDPEARSLFVSASHHLILESDLQRLIDEFHTTNPNRRGIPREELRQRAGLTDPPGAFDAMLDQLVQRGLVATDSQTVSRANFEIQLTPEQQLHAERWIAAVGQAPFAPPAPTDFQIDAALQLALTERGDVIRAAEGVFFTPSTLEIVETAIVELIEARGRVTLGDVRDYANTSRKYAQAILELLDARRVTRRIGDERILFARRTQPARGATE